MRLVIIPALALLASACATTQTPEPIIETVEVRVPVAVACVPDSVPGEPEYADSDEALLAAEDAAEFYALVLAGRDQRTARLAGLEPIIRGCR